MTIDGTSQPGYTFYPLITIDGLHAGANANGLTISGGSTTVHGLDIVRFTGNGIDLNSHGGDVIDSSIIGTDFSGDFGLGNSGSGVMIDNVPDNVIGTSLATGNLLSGNSGDGLFISGGGATGNLVQGNYIGTNYSGSTFLSNKGNGVEISGSSNNTIGGTTPETGNLISGNFGDGVLINFSDGNLVEGNYIGTNAAGTDFVLNEDNGIEIIASSNNTIGGTNDLNPDGTIRILRGNVISGNAGDGVRIKNISEHNLVEGDYIGTNTAGTQSLVTRATASRLASRSKIPSAAPRPGPATSSRTTSVTVSRSPPLHSATIWWWATTSAPIHPAPSSSVTRATASRSASRTRT